MLIGQNIIVISNHNLRFTWSVFIRSISSRLHR